MSRLPACTPLRFLAVLVLLLAAGCAGREPEVAEPVAEEQAGVDTVDVAPASAGGQTVYVPVYSHIYHQDGTREFDLTATLSIRNTDLAAPIVVTAVRYNDSSGNLVRQYVDQPLRLRPLASRSFVVEERDRTGGVGANFIVEWQAEGAVSAPIIEAVMISTSSTQGISFVTRGQEVRPHSDDARE